MFSMHHGKAGYLLRKLKGKSQFDLAKKVGVTQQMVSKWEQQRWINPELLKEILSCLKSNGKEWEAVKKLV